MLTQKVILFIVSICLLSIYFVTLSPTIAGGDSGEVVAEGCIRGTPHPPGYPLFLLMTNLLYELYGKYRLNGHEFDFEFALITNASSAVLTSMAAYFISLTTLHFTKNLLCSIFSLLAFGFSPLIWQYAVTAEVFPLNTFIASLLVYITVLFSETKNMKYALIGAFVCGLGLCNQHTIVLFEAPLILYITYVIRYELIRVPRHIGTIGCCFFMGLLPYGVLPLFAHWKPNGGSWGNVTTVDGFIKHFLRRDYGTFQLFSGKVEGKANEGLWERNVAYLHDAQFVQGMNVVPALVLIGVLGCCWTVLCTIKHSSPKSSTIGNNGKNKRHKKATDNTNTYKKSIKNNNNQNLYDSKLEVDVSVDNSSCSTISSLEIACLLPLLLPITLVFYLCVFHSLSNLPLTDKLLYGIHQRFWMQPNIIVFIYSGIGLHYVCTAFQSCVEYCLKFVATDESSSTVAVAINLCVQILFVVGSILYQYNTNVLIADQSEAYHFHHYATAILEPLPKNAILFINYDQQWTSVRYLQLCQGVRQDVTTINLSMMSYEWFASKQPLFKHKEGASLEFPGDRYSSQSGVSLVDNTTYYTFNDLLIKNIEDHDIFLGGKLSYVDSELEKTFEMVPYGLVTQFVPKAEVDFVKSGKEVAYSALCVKKWKQILSVFSTQHKTQPFVKPKGRSNAILPYLDLYPMETWEWTIGRDFKDRLTDTSAYMLEKALKHETITPIPLITALYFLETAIYFELYEPNQYQHKNGDGMDLSVGETGVAPVALLKNTGLGHMHLIQNKIFDNNTIKHSLLSKLHIFEDYISNRTNPIGFPIMKQNGDSATSSNYIESFKDYSVKRFIILWKEFLKRPEAKLDPQYQSIEKIYKTATKALRK